LQAALERELKQLQKKVSTLEAQNEKLKTGDNKVLAHFLHGRRKK
jgi:cell division protein FtsB